MVYSCACHVCLFFLACHAAHEFDNDFLQVIFLIFFLNNTPYTFHKRETWLETASISPYGAVHNIDVCVIWVSEINFYCHNISLLIPIVHCKEHWRVYICVSYLVWCLNIVVYSWSNISVEKMSWCHMHFLCVLFGKGLILGYCNQT